MTDFTDCPHWGKGGKYTVDPKTGKRSPVVGAPLVGTHHAPTVGVPLVGSLPLENTHEGYPYISDGQDQPETKKGSK